MPDADQSDTAGPGGPSDLEARLSATPNLDTDLRELLVISGRDYHWSPLYEHGREPLYEAARQRYERRGAALTKAQKAGERRLYSMIIDAYDRGTTTVGQLKNMIETQGLRAFRNVGGATLAVLNEVLREYEIEPITIRAPTG